MFWRVYCLHVDARGSYVLRAIKRFRIFGIGNVQSRADKFDSLLQGTSWEMLEGSFDWRRIARVHVNFMEWKTYAPENDCYDFHTIDVTQHEKTMNRRLLQHQKQFH